MPAYLNIHQTVVRRVAVWLPEELSIVQKLKEDPEQELLFQRSKQ